MVTEWCFLLLDGIALYPKNAYLISKFKLIAIIARTGGSIYLLINHHVIKLPKLQLGILYFMRTSCNLAWEMLKNSERISRLEICGRTDRSMHTDIAVLKPKAQNLPRPKH